MSVVERVEDSLMERLREAAYVAPAYYGDKIDSGEPVKKAFNLTHGDARALLRLVARTRNAVELGVITEDLRAALAAITGDAP